MAMTGRCYCGGIAAFDKLSGEAKSTS